MPNANYLAGVRFERQVMKDWKKQGYEVMRTAGSHGFYDVIAIPKAQDHLPMFIQCKRVETKAKAQSLIAAFKKRPPIQRSGHFVQVIDVYVSKTREKLVGIV